MIICLEDEKNLLCNGDKPTNIARVDNEVIAHPLSDDVRVVDFVDGGNVGDEGSDGKGGERTCRHSESKVRLSVRR